MFFLLNIFSFLKGFQTPTVGVAEATTLLEIVTEDGVFIATEDGNLWGVVSA